MVEDGWLLMVVANGTQYGPFSNMEAAQKIRLEVDGTLFRFRAEQYGDQRVREEIERILRRFSDEKAKEERPPESGADRGVR